ncbi:MAG: NAD-dependent epimerase/dehydratase family protein [Calditrichaeota bacterium]|nr:MAG: NAD-dependent epimerase/dehydratase family protein [Calditrichota bacterium]
MSKKWIIYGANGYTGTLMAREAQSRGLTPFLAGRSKQKLLPLAQSLNLEIIEFDLEDRSRLNKIIADFDLVLHSAGPFIHTFEPMLQACLGGGTHYLDITGEIPVFEGCFAHDKEAQEKNIAIIPGVGFDVVPTDCLAVYTAKKVKNPTDLEIAFSTSSSASRGTAKTMVEHLRFGVQIRRDGKIEKLSSGKQARRIRFSDKERHVLPISWGDVATAYRSTGIKNITTYTSFPSRFINHYRWVEPITRGMFSLASTRRLAQKWADKNVTGPDAKTRERAQSHVWCAVSNAAGETAEAWLETVEAYKFTAIAAINSVESVLNNEIRGTLTPAQAFGENCVLRVDGSRFLDAIG